jgi:hypothetical protein
MLQYKHHFQEIIRCELETGCYLGPLSQKEVFSLIGPFQTSPFSIIPKLGKADKYRNIQNLSFPRNPTPAHQSINHTIDSSLYPTTWGTFPVICSIIWHLPPGSQMAIRDVAEAYRTIPTHPSQWPGLVVRLQTPDMFAIDTCNCFGLGSAGGVYGELADASADIHRAAGIGPLSKWVDNHVFFRVRKEHIPLYNQQRHEWSRRIEESGG